MSRRLIIGFSPSPHQLTQCCCCQAYPRGNETSHVERGGRQMMLHKPYVTKQLSLSLCVSPHYAGLPLSKPPLRPPPAPPPALLHTFLNTAMEASQEHRHPATRVINRPNVLCSYWPNPTAAALYQFYEPRWADKLYSKVRNLN